MTLDPATDAKLKAFLGSNWVKGRPEFPMGGADDVIGALVQGIADARRRANTGVRKALEAAKETIEAETAITSGRQNAVQALRSRLGTGMPGAPQKIEAFLEQAITPYLMQFGAKQPWVVQEGSRAAEAFGLLHAATTKEQMTAAGKAFRSLAEEVELGQAAPDLPAPILRWYADLAQELATLPPRIAPQGV